MNKIFQGDSLEILRTLPDGIVNTCVTSPPYFNLRDYGCEGQIGLEDTPAEYITKLVELFREVKRVLRNDGTLWVNIGDSYFSDTKGSGGPSAKQDSNAGSRYEPRHFMRTNNIKPKDLIGIPWMLAFALRSDGWYLRQDIIWHKPNPMPESVTDRCTKAHEYIFLLSKSQRYYFDNEAIQEVATGYDGRKDDDFKGSKKYKNSGQTFAESGHKRWKYKNLAEKGQENHSMHLKRIDGEDTLYPVRNKRSVWTVNTKPFKEAHFAVFPPDLIVPCIKAGCPEGGVVLDPFMGSGTTAVVSRKLNRNYIGCELNPEYVEIAEARIENEIGLFV